MCLIALRHVESSRSRDWTHVPYVGTQFPIHCTLGSPCIYLGEELKLELTKLEGLGIGETYKILKQSCKFLWPFKKDFNISVYQLQLNLTTVDSSTTGVWIVWVHFMCGFFPSINVMKVLHSLWVFESIDLEPQIWKANSKVILEFWTGQRGQHLEPWSCSGVS